MAQQRLKVIIKLLEDKLFVLRGGEYDKTWRQLKFLENLINDLKEVLKLMENNNEV